MDNYFINSVLLLIAVAITYNLVLYFRTRLSCKRTNTPVAGDLWYIKNESPWEKKEQVVKIIEIKGDWVRYSSFGHDGRYECLETYMFISVYKLKSKN